LGPPQVPPPARFALASERLGPLPLLNHFLQRLDLTALLEKFVPTAERRCALSHATALGVLLRSLLVEREPIYRQGETVHGFAPAVFGLAVEGLTHVSDDRLGRALDRLFDADRAALLTELVVAVGHQFAVRFDQLHNDSTSIAFCGQYRAAAGRPLRGCTAPAITYGFSKDHRPDLKQLLFILTVDADGGVPVQFRVADGNTNDSTTHIETWNTLRAVAGRADFLYVADSKLCSRDNMEHIDRAGGRFVTVLPRSRREDSEFRQWLQTHTPPWELVWDRPNPRASDGPRDCWYVYKAALPSAEAWPVVWVYSTLLKLRQEARRRRNLAAATEALGALRARLLKARARLRGAAQIDLQVATILEHYHVGRYVKVQRTVREEHAFKQTQRGRPGPDTAYRKITRRRYDIDWTLDEAAVDYDKKSDGMYPLLSNDRSLSPAQILTAHKGQPRIEKRFEQIKSVHEIAPLPEKRRPCRGAVHPLLPRPAGAGADRARTTAGDAARGDRAVANLPRTAPMPTAYHRADPAPVQPDRAPYTARAGSPRSSLPPRTDRPAMSGAKPARRAANRLPAAKIARGNSRQIASAMCGM
jgi:transposase